MLIAIVLLILTRYFFKEWMKEIETENICFNDVPTVFIGFFAFIFIIFSFIFIYDGMAHLINPAYYSLEFFINLVK